MKRIYIKLTDNTIINVSGDSIDLSDGWIRGWKGETVVAYVRVDEVLFSYISEQKD